MISASISGSSISTWRAFTTSYQTRISESFPAFSPEGVIPVSLTSGSPETDAFRKAIEAEVLKELKGGGVHGYLRSAGSEGMSTYLQPAGISYLRPAGSEAYLTQFNTQQANGGMGAYLTQVNTENASAGMGHDSGDDEFSRRGMSERF